MTDQLQADITRGHHAERLLADEVLTGAFDGLKAEYLKAWEESRYNDTEGRERLWQAYQIIGKVRTHLELMVGNGSLARKELNALHK